MFVDFCEYCGVDGSPEKPVRIFFIRELIPPWRCRPDPMEGRFVSPEESVELCAEREVLARNVFKQHKRFKAAIVEKERS